MYVCENRSHNFSPLGKLILSWTAVHIPHFMQYVFFVKCFFGIFLFFLAMLFFTSGEQAGSHKRKHFPLWNCACLSPACRRQGRQVDFPNPCDCTARSTINYQFSILNSKLFQENEQSKSSANSLGSQTSNH